MMIAMRKAMMMTLTRGSQDTPVLPLTSPSADPCTYQAVVLELYVAIIAHHVSGLHRQTTTSRRDRYPRVVRRSPSTRAEDVDGKERRRPHAKGGHLRGCAGVGIPPGLAEQPLSRHGGSRQRMRLGAEEEGIPGGSVTHRIGAA